MVEEFKFALQAEFQIVLFQQYHLEEDFLRNAIKQKVLISTQQCILRQLESLIIGWEAPKELQKVLAEGPNENDSCLPWAPGNRVHIE